jgi:predicted nucleic-acid-binding protein
VAQVIGIDSNILLRLFETEDDPAQSSRARKVIEEHAPVYLHDVVLAEFVWTCRIAFKQSRQAIHRRLRAIADSTEFVVARPEVFARAVEAYESQKSDFADWLVGLSIPVSNSLSPLAKGPRGGEPLVSSTHERATLGEEANLHDTFVLPTLGPVRKRVEGS